VSNLGWNWINGRVGERIGVLWEEGRERWGSFSSGCIGKKVLEGRAREGWEAV